MSNSLAIAAVTVTLRHIIETELNRESPPSVEQHMVYTLRPDRFAANNTAGVNIFLYAVSPNPGWTVTDLPTRSENGTLIADPLAALDLHYVITCHGKRTTSELDGQRLLGGVVTALHANPILSRSIIRAAMKAYGTELSYLANADLEDQLELVRLSRVVLSVDEMSNLWSLFEQAPYEISLCYTASVVLIEAKRDVYHALPVRERTIVITQGRVPRIAAAQFEPTTRRLAIRGTNLLEMDTRVHIGKVIIEPTESSTNAEVIVEVGPDVPVGIYPVSIRHPSHLTESNAVAVTVPPVIEDVTVTDESVVLKPKFPLQAGQRAVVQMSRRPGSSTPEGQPDTCTFRQPPVPLDSAPLTNITLDRATVPDGEWLVRIEIDGIESGLEIVGEVYARPAITVPPT